MRPLGRLGIAVALALVACGPPPPDVVLITVDTLRADHLGSYGATDVRTPAIDALAAEGVVFERAVASLPETKPSHWTMMTSLHPRQHGVLSNASSFPTGALTLPRRFAEEGFSTAGFGGCALFDAAAGEALGFDHFDAPEKPQRAAQEVVPRAVEWLGSQEVGRPFFLWVHLFDPHMPYAPPAPFDRDRRAFSWPQIYRIAERHDGNLPRPHLRRARQLYAGEVENADHWLGRLFDALRQRGRWRETVILLTSDHGECFENGVYFDHSQCLGEGALAVPLILKAPGVAPERRRATVDHLGVAPTLTRLAGLEVPATFAGRDLLLPSADSANTAEPYAYFQQPLYRSIDVANRGDVLDRLRSVAGDPTRPVRGDRLRSGARRGIWKYLLDESEEKLFNLEDDPDERRDAAARHPDVTLAFRRAVRGWMKEHPIELRDTGELDPDLVERLISLGYLRRR